MILGFLYAQMGNHEKAVPLTQRALQISEKAAGQENLLVTAAALNNLAMLYSQMGAYDQALPLAQRAAQIREQMLGDRKTSGHHGESHTPWDFSICQERL